MCGSQLIRILLIEDHEQDFVLFRESLKADPRDFVIEWVTTLGESLPMIAEGRYHIIVTDLTLPDCKGIEVLSSIRRQCIDTPVIVFTTMDDAEVGQRLLEGGAQDYLVKGDGPGRHIARSIVHAVQRHQNLKQIKDMVHQLETSRETLYAQTQLLARKNRRLKRLYRTAQEFVDNVSHDLRTPLTVIKDYAAIVNDGLVGELNPKQKQMLSKVLVRTDDLNNMVDDLLDGSKLRAGILSICRRAVDPNEILQRTQSVVQQRADAKDLKLVLECPKDVPPVYCDVEKMVRVLTNLTINAIKYSSPGSVVTLSGHLSEDNCSFRFDVTDQGPGIEPEALERIFKRFERLRCRVSTSVKGFGLGLSIAQHLTRLNLGNLRVESTVGVGSVFSVDLPTDCPLEIVRRTLENNLKGKNTVRFVRIENTDSEAGDVGEFGDFLHGSLRSRDALIQLREGTWVWMIIGLDRESDQALERLQRDYQRYNRNRPTGPLPKYECKNLFISKPGQSRPTIMRSITRILSPFLKEKSEAIV